MMGSAHDAEALCAARSAEQIRRKLNRSWASLLSLKNGDAEELIDLQERLASLQYELRDRDIRIAALERNITPNFFEIMSHIDKINELYHSG